MSDKKLKIFVTRRWPEAAEDALRSHFEPTFNMSDVPLDKAALMDGFASHDIAAPTVSDKIDADIIAAGAKGNCQLIANYGVGVNHLASLSVLGASWEPLGSVLERLGSVPVASRSPEGTPHGPQDGSKINQKSIQNRIDFLIDF